MPECTPQEFRAAVAEHVMGWCPEHYGYTGKYWITPGGAARVSVIDWHPDYSATDDYAVLDHVRREWPWERLIRLVEHLHGVWFARLRQEGEARAPTWLQYRPGDYARAALEVLCAADRNESPRSNP